MFTEEEPTFQGRHYRVQKSLNYPRPVRAHPSPRRRPRGHCEAVGRDPDEITKTRLGLLSIGRTHEDAVQRLDAGTRG